MFSLPDFSVKRPVCLFICLVSLILFGVSSVFEMPLESTPEMNMPTMTIMTSYPDASPDEVDEMVTQKIESALSGITEVESMTSTSSEGSSMIMLEFGYDVDTDDKYQDITSALAMVQLPEDCSDPTVMQMDSSSMNSSILNISISTTDADNAVAYVEDNIVPEIERIEGVADVEVSGGTRQYIRVLLDEDTMTQYGLSMQQIASAISSAEYETTLGELNRGSISLTLIGSAEYDSWRDLEDIPISLPSGAVIYLSDVADVEMVEQERTSYSRQNGEENISISVTKEQDGNTVSICNQIEELVNEFNADSSLGLTLEIISNSGEDIYDNIMSVVTSLIEGLVIAALVLVFFFGEWKSSFIVGVIMPISVLAALILMAAFDMSINLMSLGGLVVGIGMMVDSSIVVIDSCFKSTEDGLDYVDAVHVGANLVFSSIVASTATTVVVFLPIAMMDGMSGQLFRDVCYTIVFSLLASMLGALTLVPLLFVKMRPREKLTSRSHVMMHALEGKYEALLRRALRARKTVVASAIACLAIAGFLFTQIDMELMPAGSTNTISVSVETRSGLDLENTNAIMEEIESMISEDPDVESYSLRVSGGGGGMGMMGSSSAGSVSITLKDDASVDTDTYVQNLREKTSGLKNCSVEVSKQESMSFGSSGVELRLSGPDLGDLETASESIRERLSGMEEFDSVSTSLTDGSPRAKIEVDPVLSGAYGVTPSEVLSQVSNKLSGMTAMEFTDSGTEYSVVVEYPSDRYSDISDLSGLMIDTGTGGQVALTDIAEVVYESSPTSISREDGDYVVTVSATPKSGANVRNMTQTAMAAVEDIELPEGVTLGQGSSMDMMNSEFGSIGKALLIAVYLVFAVMAIQFESVIFSLVVLFSIPFSLTGAFLALYITGSSISMTSLIGLVMLAGIVVNNAIVLVDYAGTLRREGMEVHEALVTAGKRRLRPILMSSLTTIVGLIPMAAGFGGEVEMMQGMAVVVIGGLSLSTVLTLVLIPTFYLIFDREDRNNRRMQRKIAREVSSAQ